MERKERVVVVIDGYNLYHRIDAIQDDNEGKRHDLKWCDLFALSRQFINPEVQEI